MDHNLGKMSGMNKPAELGSSNPAGSSIVPSFYPDTNFNQFRENSTGRTGQLSDIPAEMRHMMQFSNTTTSTNSIAGTPQMRMQVSNPITKIPAVFTSPVAARPQQRPQTPNFQMRNMNSINPADYAMYKNNAAIQSGLNPSLNQMHAMPNGYTNFPGYANQLGVNPSALSTQARTIPGRPMMSRNENLMYSHPSAAQPSPYHPSTRPPYNSQPFNATQVRARAPPKRTVYPSTTANTPNAATNSPATRPTTNEKSFALLYSQLSTANQVLLGECLTKLKNKTMTWDEFQTRTKEMFGDKHSIFIQAIGANGPQQGMSPQKPPGTLAPGSSIPASSPSITPVANTQSQPVVQLDPQTTAKNRPSIKCVSIRIAGPKYISFSPSQASSETIPTNPKATFGSPRPPSSGASQPTQATPSLSTPTRPTAASDNRTSGEDNRNADYDYTDVMGSVGVDLREESENIMRGVHGNSTPGANQVQNRASFDGTEAYRLPSLVDISSLKASLTSKAVEARLKELLEQMICASKHRAIAQDTYPTPPSNEIAKPIYKVIVHTDVQKQLKAIERVEKDNARKYYLRLEEGQQADEESEARVKKFKSKRDPVANNNASANARNMSEESRKHFANQTTHMFTGGHRKSWMLSSTTPRVSSPLASTSTTPRDGNKDKTKDATKNSKDRRPSSPASSHMRHVPNVSSNLVPKTKNTSNPSSPTPESNKDQSGPSPTQNSLSSSRSKPNSSLKSSAFSLKYVRKQPASRLVTAEDALFVLESDTAGRPCSSRSQLLLQAYSNRH